MNSRFNFIFNILLFFLIIIFSIYPGESNCQQKFLLSKAEMQGYELVDQYQFGWIVGKGNRTHDVIIQKWHIAGEANDQNIYIDYCQFATEPEAISCTAYAANTYATPSIWGSVNGSIIGDGTWIAITDKAFYFVRGNIAIKIGKPVNYKKIDQRAFISISQILLNKIESNLSQKTLSLEEAAKQKQISLKDYQMITDSIANSEIMTDYELYNTWDSKWLFDADSLTLGIRREWKNESSGSIIGIDISEYDSDSLALEAAKIQGENTYSKVFPLDDLDSLKSIIKNWQKWCQYGFPKERFSVVGFKGNIATQVYLFDPKGIDAGFFYAILEKLAKQISNFQQSSVRYDEGQLTEVTSQALILKQNWPNPFNSTTMISYQLSRPSFVILEIYDILGREIIKLDDRYRKEGSYNIIWDGKDNNGRQIPSGIYFCRLQAGKFYEVMNMALIR